MPWLFVPDLECSKKGSDSASNGSAGTAGSYPRPRFDLYVMSSGKSRRRPALWRGWRRREPILRHLSGTMLEPSTVALGAARFIASLPDIPASRSARPGCARASGTNAISGPTSPVSSTNADPLKSYSKMSPGTCPWAFKRSGRAYRTWATGLRRACSARLKQVRDTRESASLCWPDDTAGGVSWPTPSARDWRPANTTASQARRGRTEGSGQQLPNHVAYFWPTPRAASGSKPSCGKQTKDCIAMQARDWPTPQTHDIGTGNPERVGAGRGGGGCRNLTDEASAWNWPTPSASTGGAENRASKAKRGSGGENLKASSADWPTPQAEGFRTRGGDRCGEKGLDRQGRDWPTPRACSGEGSSGAPRTAFYEAWRTGLKPDPEMDCTCLSSLLALLNTLRGSRSSNRPPILNPRFVEMLMGWPIGSTDFTASATEWSRFRSLTLTALSTLPLLRSADVG